MPVKDALNILGFDVGTCRLPLTTVLADTPELLKEEKSKTYYLTMENKWILFLEENKSKSQYYKNNYDFIKNYYSQK